MSVVATTICGNAAKDAAEATRSRARSRPPGDLPTTVEAETTNVRVVCRLRPMSENEKKAGTVPATTASTERKEVAVVRMLAGGTRQSRSTFTFDNVLASYSSQEEVFNVTLKPLVSQVLAGFDATAFAYGQTGTGKTYTMEGDPDSEEGRGLVPRAAAAVFEKLQSGDFTDYSVSVSYLEIYNEDLGDLLLPAGAHAKLDLKDTGGGRGVCCIGLSEVPVTSLKEILQLICKARERRRVAETRMNARSSRSHCIFTMKVRCRREVSMGEFENVGRLHLVDLAGSECAKKSNSGLDEPSPGSSAWTGPVGSTDEERERRSINQSLLTLGRVIAALRENSGRVPYRDSKLTRLLQDALGGRCKTVVIATLSPALNAVEETISTLNYAEQASGIRNRPVASSLLRTTRMPCSAELRSANDTVGTSGTGLGASDWVELEMKVAYLTQEVEEAQAALASKYRETQELVDMAEKAEGRLVEVKASLNEALLAAEEGRFARSRLAEVADAQAEAAMSLVAAYNAASEHGQELARRLAARHADLAAARERGRGACAAAKTRAEALLSTIDADVGEAAESVTALHAVHCDAAGAAAEAAEDQRRILDEFACASRAAAGRADKAARAAASEARTAIEARRAAAEEALLAVEAASDSATTSAAKARDAVVTAIDQGEEMLGQQVEALGTDITFGCEMLAAMAGDATGDLTVARAAAREAYDAACEQLRSCIRQPLVSLHGQVAAGSSAAQGHASEVDALKVRGGDEAAASSGRRRCLLDALKAAGEAHEATVVAMPPLLRHALDALGETLVSHSTALAASLAAAARCSGDAKASLSQAGDTGSAGVTEALREADERLAGAWEKDRGTIGNIVHTLGCATTDQRAANVAQALGTGASTTSLALMDTLASAVGELMAARERIAREVAELREQCASEQRIVELLRQQRETLESDVACARETLEGQKAEIAAGCDRMDELMAAQERGRARALQAIVGLVTSEFEVLGQELDVGARSVCERLDSAVVLAGRLDEAAATAGRRAIETGREVVATAATWAKNASSSCDKVDTAQERSTEATRCVERASATAAEGLRSLEEMSSAWGTKCERVAELVDEACSSTASIAAAQELLRPDWVAAYERARDATEAWAEADRDVCSVLEGLTVDAASSGEQLACLRQDIITECDASAQHVAAWEQDGESHKVALENAARLCASFDKEDAAAEERRHCTVEAISLEACDATKRAEQASSDTAAILTAVDLRVQAMSGEAEDRDLPLVAAINAVAGLAGKAEAAFTGLASALPSLREVHADTGKLVRGHTVAAADEVSTISRNATDAAASCRAELADGSLTEKRRWDDLEAEGCAALAAADVVAADTAAKVAAACDAASSRASAELARSDEARGLALAALRSLTSVTATALDDGQAALSAELLHNGVYEDACGVQMCDEDVPPWPEKARAPACGLLPLPRPSQENSQRSADTFNIAMKHVDEKLALAGAGHNVLRKALTEVNAGN